MPQWLQPGNGLADALHKLARQPSYIEISIKARRLTAIPLHKSEDVPACVLRVVEF